MNDDLAVELRTYGEHRNELLSRHENKYVLIYGTDIIGTFDTDSDAVQCGYESYGNVPFLVKRIVRIERPENFVSNLIAL